MFCLYDITCVVVWSLCIICVVWGFCDVGVIRLRIKRKLASAIFLTIKIKSVAKINAFIEPIIFPLAGDRPRIVIDIKNTVSVGKDFSNLHVGGKLIKGIRSHLNRDSHILRIVLDLAPSKNYDTDQLFYEKDNVYSLEVKEDNTKD